MRARRLLVCLWLVGTGVGPAGAASPIGARSAGDSTAAATPRDARGTQASAPAARTVSRAGKSGSVTTPRPAHTTTPPARGVAPPRRLEDIHIEGEVPAPQVLFVTARDQRRLTKFHHQRYLKSCVEIGESAPLPTRMSVTAPPSAPAGAP